MNWVTILLLLFIGFVTYRAYRNGFIRELVSLCGVVLAVPLAGVFYDDMFPKVEPIVDNPELASLISFVAIMAGVIIAAQVLAYVLREAVTMLNLGVFDELAGALFGFLKAVLLAQVILIAFWVFPSPDLHGSIKNSPVATRLVDSSPFALAILPSQFDDIIARFPGEFTAAPDNPAVTPTPTPRP